MDAVDSTDARLVNKGARLLQLQPEVPVFKEVQRWVESTDLRCGGTSKNSGVYGNVIFEHEQLGMVGLDVFAHHGFLPLGVNANAAGIGVSHDGLRRLGQALDQFFDVLGEQPVVFVQKQSQRRLRTIEQRIGSLGAGHFLPIGNDLDRVDGRSRGLQTDGCSIYDIDAQGRIGLCGQRCQRLTQFGPPGAANQHVNGLGLGAVCHRKVQLHWLVFVFCVFMLVL